MSSIPKPEAASSYSTLNMLHANNPLQTAVPEFCSNCSKNTFPRKTIRAIVDTLKRFQAVADNQFKIAEHILTFALS